MTILKLINILDFFFSFLFLVAAGFKLAARQEPSSLSCSVLLRITAMTGLYLPPLWLASFYSSPAIFGPDV